MIRPERCPSKVLAILEAHACRPQAAAERVLQIVDAHLRQAPLCLRPLPRGGQHAVIGLPSQVKTCVACWPRRPSMTSGDRFRTTSRSSPFLTVPGMMNTEVPSCGTATSHSQRNCRIPRPGSPC